MASPARLRRLYESHDPSSRLVMYLNQYWKNNLWRPGACFARLVDKENFSLQEVTEAIKLVHSDTKRPKAWWRSDHATAADRVKQLQRFAESGGLDNCEAAIKIAAEQQRQQLALSAGSGGGDASDPPSPSFFLRDLSPERFVTFSWEAPFIHLQVFRPESASFFTTLMALLVCAAGVVALAFLISLDSLACADGGAGGNGENRQPHRSMGDSLTVARILLKVVFMVAPSADETIERWQQDDGSWVELPSAAEAHHQQTSGVESHRDGLCRVPDPANAK